MSAIRVGGSVAAVFCAIPVFILLRVWGNLRRELSESGIREPELTLQLLSALGGVDGFLFFAGWTLAFVAGVLLAVLA